MTTSPTFAADITDDQCREIDAIFSGFGPIRRAGLVLLARDSEHMAAAFRDDDTCEAFTALLEDLATHLDQLKRMHELMTAAHARLALSLDAEARRHGHSILDDEQESTGAEPQADDEESTSTSELSVTLNDEATLLEALDLRLTEGDIKRLRRLADEQHDGDLTRALASIVEDALDELEGTA